MTTMDYLYFVAQAFVLNTVILILSALYIKFIPGQFPRSVLIAISWCGVVSTVLMVVCAGVIAHTYLYVNWNLIT